ncbi:MAG: hypothetical protein U0872_06785 [Planctomycetaceae bacterium]
MTWARFTRLRLMLSTAVRVAVIVLRVSSTSCGIEVNVSCGAAGETTILFASDIIFALC